MIFVRKKTLLFLYIFALFISVTIIIATVGSWCPENCCPSGIFPVNTDSEHGEQHFRQKDGELAMKLQRIETELRRRYPRDADAIMAGSSDHIPTIFAITPTYARPVQKAELVRISQTLLHVRNLHWIVIEDSENKTNLVTNLLAHSGLQYTLLNVMTPVEYKLKQNDPNWLKPRGVLQRNLGVKWIRDHINPDTRPGVLYFLDDDNTYDLQLFEEMRHTKVVSVWPVALVGALRYESPIVQHGKVVGWFTYWGIQRPFAMDMAGFAINIKLLFDHPNAWFSLQVKRGFQESALLTGLKVTMDQLEPKADNCSKIFVWHTRTEKVKLKNEARFVKKRGYGSDPKMEI